VMTASSAIKRTRSDVAKLLEDFLNGTGHERDWDIFMSLPIEDPQLDAIRKRCVMLSHEFPPESPRHYCDAAGLAIIRLMISQLQ
jgi:hypothetical protein